MNILFPEKSSMSPTLANSEVFNMIETEDLARKTLSQIFIEKNNKLRAENKTEESENDFLATVQALEFDGINLRQPPVKPFTESEESLEKNMKTSRPPRQKLEFPSMDELVIKDEEK